MHDKRWITPPLPDKHLLDELAKDLNIGKDLATILMQRGITTFSEAKNFFRPSLDGLHDPYLMKGMEKAVSRILEAIEKKENILIYGDYDVDGTSAVAVVYKFISKLHGQTGYYIPDRYAEGYGISFLGIDYAAENNYSLIVALDCGIKAVDKVAYANEKHIDFIICDHHLPGEELPAAVSILNPKILVCLQIIIKEPCLVTDAD